MMTPDRMFDVLTQHPFPGASDVRVVVLGCHLSIGGRNLVYSPDGWIVGDRTIPVAFPAYGNLDDGDRAHVEIRRVLSLLDDPGDLRTQLAKMTDAHAVVSQRLVGAQREVADLEQQRDALADAAAALSEIASLCGVSLPATAAQTVEAVSALLAERDGLKGRLLGAEGSLKSIRRALDDCNAPRHYLDDDGREAAEVPAADRVRILAEIARAERALREQVERNAAVSRDHLSGVARALDDTGAARQAGAVTLSPAARVRAIGVVK